MHALDKLKEANKFLSQNGIEDSIREAEIIIINSLGIDRTVLYRDNPMLSKSQLKKINKFLKRRTKREPLQYIIGYVDFYGLKIKLGKGVLIPRPETELLVEKAIEIIKREALSVKCILDLCTGSGCIALALAREFPKAKVYGTDISEIAIRYAKENANINRINNVTFLVGNLFEPVEQFVMHNASRTTFNIIISNPPYIRRDDIKTLQPEIKDWEPIKALDGGEDGLDYYRVIIPESKSYLRQGGYLIIEMGENQSEKVRKIAEESGFTNIFLIRDYAGIERIFVAKN
ncbi:MAG: peptide chain release factor N(5)-glutamine methyltransferase [Thermodesulfovibrionales bacterium]